MTDPRITDGRWNYPYTPTGRQRVLHQCEAQEVLFGGSAGPGKTEALLAAGVTFCLLIPNGRAFLFRRTYRMLDMEIIPRLLARIPDHIAHYRAQDHSFTFNNGAVFRLGYLATDADLMNYQGVEIHLALFDELTQFGRYQYTYIRSRLRMAGQVAEDMQARGWTPRILSTSNPTGPGHGWVKRMFVDPSPGMDKVFLGGIEEGEPLDGLRSMAYIPAYPGDNPYLDIDGYRRQLAGLDPILRRALELGDWDVLQGTRFSQFRRAIHVIEPEKLPISMIGYPRCVGVDFGIAAPFAAVWMALLPDDLVVVYRALHRTDLTAEQQAQLILDSEMPGERDIYRPIPVALDPSCWARPVNQAIKPLDPAEPAKGSVAWWYRRTLGNAVVKADNQRIAGWHLVDHHLQVRSDGLPRLLIYSTCTDLIRTLPEQLRGRDPEDIDTSGDDHDVDALRYGLMHLVGGGLRRVPPQPADPMVPNRDIEERYDTVLSAEHRTRLLRARGIEDPWARRETTDF